MKLSPLSLATSLALLGTASASRVITVDLQSCVAPNAPPVVAYDVGANPPKAIASSSKKDDVFDFEIPNVSGDELKIQVYAGTKKPKGNGDLDVGVAYTLITLKRNPTENNPSTIAQTFPGGLKVKFPDPWLSDATFWNPGVNAPSPFRAVNRQLRHTTPDGDDNVAIIYCRLFADALLKQ